MLIRPDDRAARLSVRELAEFTTGPSFAPDLSPSGRWRTEVGRQWHDRIREYLSSLQPLARFEVPIEATLVRDHWQLTLNGRIDQLFPEGNGLIIQEVKTVTEPLPGDPSELLRLYPSYFRQAAIYFRLWKIRGEMDESKDQENQPLRVRLLFVHVDEGITQTVDLTEDAEAHVDRALEGFLEFARERHRALGRVRSGAFSPAFSALREEQAEVLPVLRDLVRRPGIHGFEAPTGFGKTGLVLTAALECLRDGLCERIIYLTGKSTGQLQVRRTLDAMLGAGNFAHFFQMRNRAEHGDRSAEALSAAEIRERWERSGLHPHSLFEHGTVTLERVMESGANTGVPAYSISRALLPFAEVWLGDYNYVFSPSANGVFLGQPGFDPRQTCLIVDEAHNLPSRVESGWSFILSADRLDAMAGAVQFLHFPGRLPRCLHELGDWIRGRRTGKALDDDDRAVLGGLVVETAEAVQRIPWSADELTETMWIDLQELVHLQQSLARPGLRFLVWSRRAGELRIDCIDAAQEIGDRLREFAIVLLTSATLQPENSLRRACGLDPREHGFLSTEAPWRKEACTVAIDARVDTRYSQRRTSHETTARTVVHWASAIRGPLAVFFPSYQYAQDVLNYVASIDRGLRVAIPPRDLDLPAQERFLEEALISAHVLFLVLGSGYTESINLLGGRVSDAMVVGPALPEVNPVQEARMNNGPWVDRDEAFREVYQVPGMIRINQALGRLVREPGHHARILLHCKRFRDPSYLALLAPEYHTGYTIHSPAELDDWLRRTF